MTYKYGKLHICAMAGILLAQSVGCNAFNGHCISKNATVDGTLDGGAPSTSYFDINCDNKYDYGLISNRGDNTLKLIALRAPSNLLKIELYYEDGSLCILIDNGQSCPIDGNNEMLFYIDDQIVAQSTIVGKGFRKIQKVK